jgi:DNA-binding transcriptional ArsR family regulator
LSAALHHDRAGAERAVERLRLFAQPVRLMILSLLLEGEHMVGALEDATAIGQPAMSQQLAELRRAGLVVTRRAARQVFYRIAPEQEGRIKLLLEWTQDKVATAPVQDPYAPAGSPAARFARMVPPPVS